MSDLRVTPKKFRPELEGVRAVAALLVAVYHIWLGRVSGGVDIFFVVSGYLITTSLISRILRDQRIQFSDFYLGLARRLFPLAFTVIFISTLLSIFILPKTVWSETIAQVFASIFYMENWQLAWNSVDYLAQNNEASPFQHFWALSLQGQFYLTWPLLITIVYIIAKKIFRTPVRKTLLVVLILMFAVSLTYSIYLTNVNQPYAYFNTFARVWEFSLGGILALLLPYIKPIKVISVVIGWLGLLIILLTGIIFSVSSMFPGYVALLPLTGVIFIIISAENTTSFGVARLLSSRPLLYFGGISYGFYLWHWPILIFYFEVFDKEVVPFFHGLILLLISFILATITIHFIEKPIRALSIHQHKKIVVKYVASFTGTVLLLTVSWSSYLHLLEKDMKYEMSDYPGALVISDAVKATKGIEPYPNLLTLDKDLPHFYEDPNCYSAMSEGGRVKECIFGELENPDLTIALVGGSHSGHWFPALEEIADNRRIQLKVLNKDACRFSTDDFGGRESCEEWNENVTKYLKEDPVDIIFTTSTVGAGDHVPEGYLEKWKEFEGISEIFAIRDNPRMPKDVRSCLEKNVKNPSKCGKTRDKALSSNIPWSSLDNKPPNVTFGDLSDYFCVGKKCSPVIGNVFVYRDAHHLTATYAKTLSKALEAEMNPLIERLQKKDRK
ncbi:acyltransferase family protein [Sporosarcina saromensis]|uniref:Acyltransferase family protein n=1 Tax=Sporosarcina saromensis TaxID=359365 RepID=A0ABU4G803_9BACL|nr:acyltransferase family protein [Sporosarcina saromensis]MDW0113113.1 acyltransferase family protein [Sporosarcina saromensis]